ncbi:MAG: hypothetical protein QOF89_3918 [Acidobacteriota bacterium]|jgi:hypothetical protein|nr:hypothetical protein [Acidobacteriota bacterium]
MKWIDRLEEEQEAAKRRDEAERAHSQRVTTGFHAVAERLAPQIRNEIGIIKNRLGIELQLTIGASELLIAHGEKRPAKRYYFIRITKQGTGPELFVEATEDRHSSVPDDWQGTMAEWVGERPPELKLLTSLEELEARQLDALLEWLTGSALGKKPQLPYLDVALAQQEKARRAYRKRKGISLPFAIFLGLVGLAATFVLWYYFG